MTNELTKKLIIQIPCLNEAEYLSAVLSELPREITGISKIEWLIIDDGSTDNTAEIARLHGVDHIVVHNKNKGLAEAFKSGMDACLKHGADIIVNTDADNQYPSKYISDLVRPILEGKADIVIGDRETNKIQHFSFTKKILQKLGSWAVRKVSGTDIPDAPSGFRSYSKEAVMQLNILTKYTYTLETIIQAGKKNLNMMHIPIQANFVGRPSRLLKSNWNYVVRSTGTILKLFVLYEPLKFFFILALPFFLIGSGLWIRYLVLTAIEGSLRGAYIQSVIVGGIAILMGVFFGSLGLIGELMAKNEEEDQILKLRKWANNIFNLLANLFFNQNYKSNFITDSINGFRGFKRESFNKLNLDALGYTIEYQSTIRSFKKRMKIVEIPTIEGPRIGGESYAKSIPTVIRFINCLFKELFVFHPK